ncbi:TrmB family transcriptional regulator [Salarchaeum sp. JOR-1]|uniref:TrmB family transcriptional regulator n=1 Tax=Salarchaeum sp. JOR-1 TaxID=2599399 RepID=UPI0011987EED|nr:helix-turn-helix domain-containing protein [Salarchaeum sp. JOR-1]QDX41208.1 TrmB family transcriptional regulator [Salarchaeum sp. JOR-1]
MNESAAVDALARLGLSTYEARVFVALQRLGTGTASDVAEVADVPRSQVYGAAEDLEHAGLLEVQQTTPRRYRPVSLDAARDHLRERFEDDRDRAFDYIESVQGELADGDENREAIWTVTGTDAVTDRIADAVEDADDRVLFGTGNVAFFPDAVRDALVDAADRGVAVQIVSEDDAVIAAASDAGLETSGLTTPMEPAPPSSRVALVDGNTIVLGVHDGETETAMWSANSRFASVLTESLETWFANELDV